MAVGNHTTLPGSSTNIFYLLYWGVGGGVHCKPRALKRINQKVRSQFSSLSGDWAADKRVNIPNKIYTCTTYDHPVCLQKSVITWLVLIRQLTLCSIFRFDMWPTAESAFLLLALWPVCKWPNLFTVMKPITHYYQLQPIFIVTARQQLDGLVETH